jgi:hypothetical protein
MVFIPSEGISHRSGAHRVGVEEEDECDPTGIFVGLEDRHIPKLKAKPPSSQLVETTSLMTWDRHPNPADSTLTTNRPSRVTGHQDSMK